MPFHPPSHDSQLAQVNVARLKASMGDPLVAPFVNAIDKVNAVAEGVDGFIWRHTEEAGGPSDVRVTADPMMIYNASVWRDVTSLEAFVWDTVHAKFFAQRERWFNAMDSMHFAMWWVPAGTTFNQTEAMDRLAHYDTFGPTEKAFGWSDAPGAESWKKAR